MRPAMRENASRMKATRSSSPAFGPRSRPCAVIAPALIIGLSGRPLASTDGASKGSPEGSTPMTRSTSSIPRSANASAKTSALEEDWIANSTSASPAVTVVPSTATSATPHRFSQPGSGAGGFAGTVPPDSARTLSTRSDR